MKICFDIDDYHSFPRWDCTDILSKLIDMVPEIKLTLFFTPLMKGIPLTDYPQALDRLRDLIQEGHVEVFPHGLTHVRLIKGEFGVLPKRIAEKKVLKSIHLLKKAHISFKEGFKFPWHIYNRASLRVLEGLGYVLFLNKQEADFTGNQVGWVNNGNLKKRYIQTEHYKYGRPAVPDKDDIVYYHGHAQNFRENGIRESCDNLIRELSALHRTCSEIEYIFCSQIIDETMR